MTAKVLARALVLGVVVTACSAAAEPTATTMPPTTVATTAPPATSSAPTTEPEPIEVQLVAVGDIGRCDREADEETAALASNFPSAVILLLGDIAYPDGTREEFEECFHTSWGVHKDRLRPSPGNHDYRTDDAAPYFEYFGAVGGDPDTGYYSFDLAGWHVVSLNTNCKPAGGCDGDDPQAEWLAADLANSDATCSIAFMHHPRFSSGSNGSFEKIEPLWEVLYEHGVDIALSGHDHNYERFAPQNPYGELDAERGIRQFVVGTGGGTLREFESDELNSEFRVAGQYGILEMSLREGFYSWRFWAVDESEPLDEGEATCVGP